MINGLKENKLQNFKKYEWVIILGLSCLICLVFGQIAGELTATINAVSRGYIQHGNTYYKVLEHGPIEITEKYEPPKKEE
jgi:hypothetical protein